MRWSIMPPPWMPCRWCMGGGCQIWKNLKMTQPLESVVAFFKQGGNAQSVEGRNQQKNRTATAVRRWMVMGMAKSEIEFSANQREKLSKLLCTAHSISTEAACFEDATYARQLKMEADHLIANGVTIPVRCKDCKHMEVTPDGLRWCNVWGGINGMGDEGFCNYGERKEK